MINHARAVVFDFDGTIIDSNKAKRVVFKEVLLSCGIGEGEADAIQAWYAHYDRYQFFERLCEDYKAYLPSVTSAEKLTQQFSSLCHQRLLQCKKLEGIDMFLEKLQEGNTKVYVSSATPDEHLRPILQELNFMRFFSAVYGGPSKKIDHIKAIQRESNLRPEDITFIGDSDDDYAAAMQAGCNFIGVVVDRERFSVKPAARISNFLDHRLSALAG